MSKEMERLVERHCERLVNAAQKMLHNRHEAEDVVQETFIRAFQRQPIARNVSAWLYTVTINLCRDVLKKRKTARLQPLVADVEAPTCVATDADFFADELRRHIAALPYQYREAFLLRYVQQLEYFEIEATTQIPADTLKVRAFRAREMLRLKIKEEA